MLYNVKYRYEIHHRKEIRRRAKVNGIIHTYVRTLCIHFLPSHHVYIRRDSERGDRGVHFVPGPGSILLNNGARGILLVRVAKMDFVTRGPMNPLGAPVYKKMKQLILSHAGNEMYGHYFCPRCTYVCTYVCTWKKIKYDKRTWHHGGSKPW